MRISIVNPFKKIFEGNAQEIILPGEDGEVAVLDFHQPFLYCLTKGFITVKEHIFQQKQSTAVVTKQGNSRIMIKRGVALMQGNEVLVLVETDIKETETNDA